MIRPGAVCCAAYGVDEGRSNYVQGASIRPPLKVLWKFAGSGRRGSQSKPRYVDTPLCAAGLVYFAEKDGDWFRNDQGFGFRHHGRVYCLDAASGEVVWTFENDVSERITVSCVANGVVVLAGETTPRTRGVDALTGELLWSNSQAPSNGTNFCLNDGKVVFHGHSDESAVSGVLDPLTGAVAWKAKTSQLCYPASACSAGLLLIDVRGDEFCGVVCRDRATGSILWERDLAAEGRHTDFITGTAVPGRPSSAVSNGSRLYCVVGAGGVGNHVFCLDSWTANTAWGILVSPGPMQPAIVGGDLCWVGYDGDYYRADAATGRVFVRELLASDVSTMTSIGVAANHHMWHAAGQYLRAVSLETGRVDWVWKHKTQISGPTIYGDRVYVASSGRDPQILCLGEA